MKFNWGTGIFLVYSVFALSMFWAVYQSTKQDNSLVVDNYYEQDLQYQARFDQIKNAQTLSKPLGVHYDRAQQIVLIDFPEEIGAPAGEIQFYRPSDRRFDFTKPIAADSAGQQSIAAADLVGGRWVVKVNWQNEGVSYYAEQDLMLP